MHVEPEYRQARLVGLRLRQRGELVLDQISPRRIRSARSPPARSCARRGGSARRAPADLGGVARGVWRRARGRDSAWNSSWRAAHRRGERRIIRGGKSSARCEAAGSAGGLVAAIQGDRPRIKNQTTCEWENHGADNWSSPRNAGGRKTRVATVPEVVEKLIKLGFAVAVESGAGDAANCSDDSYRAAGATGHRRRRRCGRPPTSCSRSACRRRTEVGLLREGGTLIGFIWPAQNPELMQQLAAKKATVLAIDALPRSSPARRRWTR
jgi:hypothetical protein